MTHKKQSLFCNKMFMYEIDNVTFKCLAQKAISVLQ